MHARSRGIPQLKGPWDSLHGGDVVHDIAMLNVPAISCLPDFASHLNRPARTCVVAFAGQGFSSKKPGPKTQKKSSKDPESTPISDVEVCGN